MSKLKINLSQSESVPVGDVPNMGELVALLGCSQSKRAILDLACIIIHWKEKHSRKLVFYFRNRSFGPYEGNLVLCRKFILGNLSFLPDTFP